MAERAYLVFKRFGIANKLRLIKYLVHLFNNFVSNLNANANVNSSGLMGNVVLSTDFFQPVGAPTPCGNDGVGRKNIKIFLAV